MKRLLLSTALLLSIVALVSAQDERVRQTINPEPADGVPGIRSRVVGSKVSNHAERKTGEEPQQESNTGPLQRQENSTTPRWGNTAVIVPSITTRPGAALSTSAVAVLSGAKQQVIAPKVEPAVLTAENNVASTSGGVDTRTMTNAKTVSTTSIYRVGVGDVLDVRLSNLPTRESTLFTVQKNGGLEHPLLGSPITVAGLTTDEIAALLDRQIKVIQTRVSVTVRDYASHTILLAGLIDNPGKKNLRREAMPLYAVMAEALPRAEAEIATITRSGQNLTVPLNDNQAMTTLILPGDEIHVSTRSVNRQKYIYLSGEVTLPGEHDFREGMTLTQALMAAGGVTRGARINVKVSRRNEAGFLTGTEYSLPAIASGKAQDPLLQAGDRVEVTRTF